MTTHTLTIDELHELLTERITDCETLDKTTVSSAMNWERELVAATYLAARVILRCRHDLQRRLELIQKLYSLNESLWITLNEIDIDFVDYMLRNVRQESLLLEEEIVGLIDRHGRHEYAASLRL